MEEPYVRLGTAGAAERRRNHTDGARIGVRCARYAENPGILASANLTHVGADREESSAKGLLRSPPNLDEAVNQLQVAPFFLGWLVRPLNLALDMPNA